MKEVGFERVLLGGSLLVGDFDIAAEPCETFKDSFASGRATGLNFPGVVLGDALQVEHV